ncbi:40s ribosomal protein s5-1 [Hordeum vulgare]|nr:40s ribosomal protein s5-1 [Hordeum vulgare]
MLHIRDVEGPKNIGSVETRLEAMEQQVFKCQRMVERGLNANHMMITEFTNNHKMDAIGIGKHLSRLYDRVDQLQGQIYDLQNQNCEENLKNILMSVYGNKDAMDDELVEWKWQKPVTRVTGADLERLESMAFGNVSVEAGGMAWPDEPSQGAAGAGSPHAHG